MPVLKIWSADHTIKKIVAADTLSDVIKQACEKGICSSENVKVFLQDWTELEEESFQEVVNELGINERIFIVADVIPQAEPGSPGPSGMMPLGNSSYDSQNTSACNFKFDVERIPLSVKDALHLASAPIGSRERKELIRCVVDQMRRKASRPRREFLRVVAEDIVRAYPSALEDRGIDGKLLGRGYDSFLQQLENRVENLCRGGKRPAVEAVAERAQKSAKSAYGCLNWQPVPTSEVENEDEKMEFCKREGKKSLKDIDVPLATKYMQETYSQQRKYINATDPVHHTAEFKQEWPLLFCRPFFYQHADHLLGKCVKDTFQQRLTTCAPLLLEHLKTSAQKSVMYWVVETEHAAKSNDKASYAALFPLLAAHFKEEQGDLFRIFEDGTSVTDICCELPSTPIVVALGGIFTKKCFVICEQLELFAEATDFAEAMCLEFLLYYVFNMVYPGSVATTLEFVQRQLFDINPSSGNKFEGKRKSRTSVNVKVMKLAQAIRMIL